MTSTDVALGALLVGLCGASVCALILAGRWIERRACDQEAERTAAATFEADFIVENADVAGPDAEIDALIELAHIEDMLDEVLDVVAGWRR